MRQQAAPSWMRCSRLPWRRPKPCGSCANRCPRHSATMAQGPVLEQAMFDLVESLGGSISAEHGIGRLKAAEFARRGDPVELAVMRELKRALDPKGIMNPGKVLCVR